jgi:hypothetical protein
VPKEMKVDNVSNPASLRSLARSITLAAMNNERTAVQAAHASLELIRISGHLQQ